ncbi:hypothetical protein JTE90_005334 [Oedothorax gibbosus]|uniref:Uncharacterized protein n=1 Tax=Oedothorax gibbosus TaxID=931172 RepID=A0AAV6UIB5_9ARAC|nr:hypothetical protein JTE90_005334 [Oedothorax gibbosus]
MSSQVVRPILPYNGSIPGGLHEGKLIEVKGTYHMEPIGSPSTYLPGLIPSCPTVRCTLACVSTAVLRSGITKR